MPEAYHFVGQLPQHKYVWINDSFILKEPQGEMLPAVWYGLVSFPGRAWGCTVMLETGAIYRNLPPHAIAFRKASLVDWSVQQAQCWDCYSYAFTTIEYDYLSNLRSVVRSQGVTYEGRYLFSVAPIADGFTAYPEQNKEFAFVKLDNGRMSIQPTNHMVFTESSFTDNRSMKLPKGYRRQMEIHRCE